VFSVASINEVMNHRGSIALFMMIKPWLRGFLGEPDLLSRFSGGSTTIE